MSLTERIAKAAQKDRETKRNMMIRALGRVLLNIVKEPSEAYIGPVHIVGGPPGGVSIVARIEDHYFALHPQDSSQLMYVVKDGDSFKYVGPFKYLSEVEGLIEQARQGYGWTVPPPPPQLWNRQVQDSVNTVAAAQQPSVWTHVSDPSRPTMVRMRPSIEPIDEIC